MGIENHMMLFLLQAKKMGVAFNRTLTLGRQVNYIQYEPLKKMWRPLDPGLDASITQAKFVEPLFKHLLAAAHIDSMDISTYEDATIIHNLNIPIENERENSYDAIIDGGLLEHVFNFPVAINNCIRSLKKGGSMFIFTPANNFCGHGFYQFSPELFYSLFSEENGFRVERMCLVESFFSGIERGVRRTLYQVQNPKDVRSRVTLINSYPTTLMLHAIKTQSHPVSLRVPFQSDYVDLWIPNQAVPQRRSPSSSGIRWFKTLMRIALQCIPRSISLQIRSVYERMHYHSLKNKRFYIPVDDA